MSDKLHKLPAAGLLRRLMCGLYDWLLVLAIMMVLSVPLVAVLGDAVTPGNSGYQSALVAVAAAYFAGFWSWGGQTAGMRAWRVRLLDREGSAVPLSRCLLRFAAACISALPAGLGFWWSLVDTEGLCWHDRWTGTRLRVLPKTAGRQKLREPA